MYSQKLNCTAWLFPKQNYNVLSPISTLMCLWEIYMYKFPGSVCLFCCSQIGIPILGIYSINRSQTHECRNWEKGRCAVSFMRIHKSDFLYSAHSWRDLLLCACFISECHMHVLCLTSWLFPVQWAAAWSPRSLRWWRMWRWRWGGTPSSGARSSTWQTTR